MLKLRPIKNLISSHTQRLTGRYLYKRYLLDINLPLANNFVKFWNWLFLYSAVNDKYEKIKIKNAP